MPTTTSHAGNGRRYDFLNVIGRGGFGTVYKAWMRGEGGFDKLVAVKVPNDERTDPAQVARLKDEARMLGLLRHRCIVGVDGLALLDGKWSVVMEYIDGVDLRTLIRAHGPLPIGVALEITAEVAAGLHAAWEAEDVDGQPLTLMHRDIKPSNIMVTANADVKVLDFGIAKATFETRESISQNCRVGSLLFMAPERLDLMDHATSDVYSLGAVLYGMLTAKRIGRTSPQAVAHKSVMQQAMQHLRNSPASDNVDVIDLVQAMLRFSPNGRPKAQFVERQCREILDKMSEQNLRGWAKRVIPPLAEQDVEATEDMASWTGSTYPDATGGSISADLATMSGAVKVPPKSTGPPIWATVALTALAGWSLAMFLMAAVWVLMPRIYEADRFVPLAEGIVEKLVADELEADSDPVGSAATEDAAEDPAGQE